MALRAHHIIDHLLPPTPFFPVHPGARKWLDGNGPGRSVLDRVARSCALGRAQLNTVMINAMYGLNYESINSGGRLRALCLLYLSRLIYGP